MANSKLLKKLRDVYGKYTDHLKLNKEQVFLLLGKDQNLWSGIYKEGLIKDILKKVLPEGIGIDSGFIYGFDEIPNSKQLDVIIWDSLKHSAIFKTEDFVILSPESVIAIIEVKTNKQHLIKGLENISSIIPLDYTYKLKYKENYPDGKEFKPISKYLIFYKGIHECENNDDDIINDISNYYCDFFNEGKNIEYKNEILKVLDEEIKLNSIEFNSTKLFIEILKTRNELKRYYPRLILDADDLNTSFYFGFGENTNEESHYKWIPNVYKQNYSITTPFEKFIYYLLQDIYEVNKIQGISMLCGWADISPKKGYRGDDISELDEENGLPTIFII
jgi:hypothetical protein